jgi:rubrerythrin
MWLFGKRRDKSKKSEDGIDETLHNLNILARIEGEIAQFYYLCAEIFADERGFWEEMAASERRHVTHIQEMQELARNNPKEFKPGGQFTTASIRLFEMSIRDLPSRNKLTEIARRDLLSLVRDIENSAVETHYSKIVETDNEKFRRLAEEIDSETAAHKKLLDDMLAALQGEMTAPPKGAQNS